MPRSAQSAPPSNDILSLVGPNIEDRWNLSAEVGTPVVVTYNFPTTQADYLDDIPGYAGLDAAQQQYATTALQTWAEVSGLTLIEVPETEQAEITVQFRDMTGQTNAVGNPLSGFAYYPGRYSYGDQSYVPLAQIGGDIFLNADMYEGNSASLAPGVRGYSIMLHEVGHALGLEHPFSGDVTIDPDRDNGSYTVMSYDRSHGTTQLGTYDLEAMQLLYGPEVPVSAAWDDDAGVLVQTAMTDGAILFGHSVDNRFDGSGGDDEFHNVNGGDIVHGGGGKDLALLAEGMNGVTAEVTDAGLVLGLDAGDALFTDVEVFSFFNQVVTLADLIGPGTEIAGTDADETLNGTDGADLINGGGGNDSIEGGFSADTLTGDAGDDTLIGDGGGDDLSGGDGDDALSGGDGDDQLDGGGGNDLLAGGAGVDTISGQDGDDLIGGGLGDDIILGGADDDTIGAGQGDDSADGGTGNDIVNGGAGDDTLMGGDGNDIMGASFGDDLVMGNGGDDDMGGGTGKDMLSGGAGNDTLGAGEGDDTVIGGAGDDFVAGGGRDDVLLGGDGDDILNAGTGQDTLSGGAGADLFIFNQLGSGEVNQITDFEDGQDLIRMSLSTVAGPNTFGALTLAGTSIEGVSGVAVSVAGHTINVLGVDLADLGAEDFIFI